MLHSIFVDLSSSICELRLHRVNFAVFADSLSGRIQAEDAQRAYRDMWTRAYGTGAALAFISTNWVILIGAGGSKEASFWMSCYSRFCDDHESHVYVTVTVHVSVKRNRKVK